MIVYTPENLLGSYNEARHLPNGHLEVHLRKLEQSFEKARHPESFIACRGRASKSRGSGRVVPRERDVRIHWEGGTKACPIRRDRSYRVSFYLWGEQVELYALGEMALDEA
jgi:hypothetical protein